MNTPSWMMHATPTTRAKPWVRRNLGRRAGDRRLSLESTMVIGVVLAWAWGVYEMTLLFLR
jgi:hypothetical protein